MSAHVWFLVNHSMKVVTVEDNGQRLTGNLYIFNPSLWNELAIKDMVPVIRFYDQRIMCSSDGEFLTFCNSAMVMYIVWFLCWITSAAFMIRFLCSMASESLGCYKLCGFSKDYFPTALLQPIFDHYYWGIANKTGFCMKPHRIMLDQGPMFYMF